MKNYSLFILALALLISACKKDETDDRPKCQSVEHAPQEFLDYWFFPKGSWWVYKLKDSDPAVYDTVRNGNRHIAFYPQPYEDAGLGRHCRMFYIHDLVHSNREYFSNPAEDRPGAEGLRGYKFEGKWIIEQSWAYSIHAAEDFVFFHPFSIGEVLSPNYNWVADTNSVVTPSYTFPNSVMMYGGNPDTSANPQRRIYFSKGVGITKRKYFNGNIWELVNYHINR